MRPVKLLLGTATGLGLAAAAWLASRRRFQASEPNRPALPRSGVGIAKAAAAPKAALRRSRAAANRSRASRTTKGVSARKAPVARRSPSRA
jgi:hypothetical protein